MRLYLKNVAANIIRLSVFILIFIPVLFFKTVSAIFRIQPLISVKTKKTPISAQLLTSINSNKNINLGSASCNPSNNRNDQTQSDARPRRRSFSLINNVKHHNDMPKMDIRTGCMDSIEKKSLKCMLKNYNIDTKTIIMANPSNLDQQALEIVQKLREYILAHTNKEGLDNLYPSEDETNDVYKAIVSAIKNGDGAKYLWAIEQILSSRLRKVRFKMNIST
ncbi:MAG: hypothetical protein VXZ73_03200 [Pseudomonadota bacterium]|nr:hypothetical protein [Pseudomonadota bacterium]MEC8977773.1 hypothetical protein [Pseudomonadota bacterium]